MLIRIATETESIVVESTQNGAFEITDICDMLDFKADNITAKADPDLFRIASDICMEYNNLIDQKVEYGEGLEYRGYVTIPHLFVKEQEIRGKILGISDDVAWSADDIRDVEYAFHAAVDNYIDMMEGK